MKAIFFYFLLITLFVFTMHIGNQSNSKEKFHHLPIYELNIRQFSEKGDFLSIIPEIPRLKKMGIGIIWLMPIHPIGEKERKGKLGSYYSIKDYFTVNPEFGTEEDFKKLVKSIHEAGLYVIIDWVVNHTSWDNLLIKKNPDFYTKDKDGNMVPPVEDWTDVADLNYENQETREYMKEALIYWIKKFNIDGYRCDVAEMVPSDFWADAIREIRKIKPIFMLAEGAKKNLLENGFDMIYSWKLYHFLNDVQKGNKKLLKIDSIYKSDLKEYGGTQQIMRFITNHDENSWNGTITERLGPYERLYTTLYLTFPGRPLVYSGQEAGMNKRLDFFDRDPIEWKEDSAGMIIEKVLNTYQQEPALNSGDYQIIKQKSKEQYCCVRIHKNKKAIILLNFSNTDKEFIIKKQMSGTFKELFSGKTNENINKITLKAQSYEIWLN